MRNIDHRRVMAYFSGSDGRLFLDDNGTWRNAARTTNWQLTTSQATIGAPAGALCEVQYLLLRS